MGRPTVLIRFGVGWGVDSLNVQKIGRWARAAQPGFLLMFNAELQPVNYILYVRILLQEMWHAYQYNASIKETIAISVKYHTVFPFSFVHCLIGGTLWAHNTVEVTGKCDNLYEQKIPLLIYGQKWSLEMYTGFHSMLHYSQSTLWAHYEHRRTIRDYSEPQRERECWREHKKELYRDHYGRRVQEKTL